VARVVRVYSAQAGDHWLFEEQLRRWTANPLTSAQRGEVERLSRELASLRKATTSILALAEELKASTIESLLAKSDLEVGLEELARRSRGDPAE
jgi:hypothetical protein